MSCEQEKNGAKRLKGLAGTGSGQEGARTSTRVRKQLQKHGTKAKVAREEEDDRMRTARKLTAREPRSKLGPKCLWRFGG